jgi:hypothetical protein
MQEVASDIEDELGAYLEDNTHVLTQNVRCTAPATLHLLPTCTHRDCPATCMYAGAGPELGTPVAAFLFPAAPFLAAPCAASACPRAAAPWLLWCQWAGGQRGATALAAAPAIVNAQPAGRWHSRGRGSAARDAGARSTSTSTCTAKETWGPPRWWGARPAASCPGVRSQPLHGSCLSHTQSKVAACREAAAAADARAGRAGAADGKGGRKRNRQKSVGDSSHSGAAMRCWQVLLALAAAAPALLAWLQGSCQCRSHRWRRALPVPAALFAPQQW